MTSGPSWTRAGIRRAHLYGASEGGPQSVLFAASFPERVKSLILYGTYPSFMKRRDYPQGKDMTVSEYSRFVDQVVASAAGDREAMKWFWDMWSPTLSATPGWFDVVAGLPQTTSPGAARLIWEAMYEADV
jgi:pimeloyl-ACP methyl ester carboxylesterase